MSNTPYDPTKVEVSFNGKVYDSLNINDNPINPINSVPYNKWFTSNPVETIKPLKFNQYLQQQELTEELEHDIMKLVHEVASLVQLTDSCEDDFIMSTTHDQLNCLYDKKLTKLEELLNGVYVG